MKKFLILLLFTITIILVSCSDDITTITSDVLTTDNMTTEEAQTETPTTETPTTDTPTTDTPTDLPSTVSPTTITPTTEEPSTTVIDEIDIVEGIEDQEIIVNHYFNPMMDIVALSTQGKDISSYMKIVGSVDYGMIGEYQLTYHLSYKDDVFSKTITVTVVDGNYVSPAGSRPNGLSGSIILGEGSYYTGQDASISHPRNPGYLKSNLLNDAIPSSGWWTTLLAENYGASNGIYTNPLRTAFSNEGLEITNPLDGFVQYWNPEGYQTIAQFPISLKDSYLKSSDLNAGYMTEVIDYSDSYVKVAMKNSLDGEDEMVITLVQGSPYIFAETANKNALTLTMDSTVTIEYYDLFGTQITSNSYDGNAIIVKMVQRHSGYDTSPPANVGQPQYTDKYYLVNVPDNSSFSIATNVLSMNLGDGNYISIVAINDLSEAEFYHNHAYTLITNTSIDYEIDYENSLVYTNYMIASQRLKESVTSDPLLALMPHHYKYSDVSLTDYSYRTVRGTLRVMEGNYFQTVLSFNGLLPGYTLPDNAEMSLSLTKTYLEDLDSRTEVTDTENFLNDEGPYWNSKALYPLSQGLIIADQLGETALKQSFIDKLRYLLSDWYSYSGITDEKYLFYNNAWGGVYYSNDDFATA
ncbi:MAG: hypothetical protein PF513_06705, partial [Tenericutes bacterium]|nr:hypothetical protein [Mycoplasmatota bacterium]